jgi:hypothetical protein
MMDGLFHYVMKSKIKTPFGDAQQSHGARQSHKLPSTKLFELNVQTLTLLGAGFMKAERHISLALSR